MINIKPEKRSAFLEKYVKVSMTLDLRLCFLYHVRGTSVGLSIIDLTQNMVGILY